jgi:hypothetical protein
VRYNFNWASQASKRIVHTFEEDGSLSEAEAQRLLNVLCVKYGFCLPPLWSARLERNPPRSINKFLNTVFHAEGLDPISADSGMYKAMREEVRVAFERSKSPHRNQDA